MKHTTIQTLILLLTLSLFATKARAWGEITSYVLDAPDEKTLNTISTGESLPLSGPGARLTFQAKRQTLAVNYFFVQISTNGGSSWSDLANPSLGTSYESYGFDISTDVTHIRFITKTGATLRKYYKDVKVTRATTLSTSTTTLDFGTVTNRTSSTQNALINYNNTTYNQQVTGTCTDPNFTVTATTVGATGDNQQIPVVFTPTTAGTHSGTVTLTMNGKTVTFSVTGVGQTTYYTRATAVATQGGSAYVSFTSFDAATTASVEKNSGLTTAANASATAYYRAVAHQRYAFLGWKSNLSDANYVSTEAEFIAPAYTYNSENAATPTVKTYYAVFEEKPNVITLEPTVTGYDTDTYEIVTLHRTFLQGYNTIALPFATTVAALSNRSDADDWVAQLSAVTYNAQDGYTLFFQQVTNGRIQAFQPYVLHLGQPLTDPSWSNIELTEATPSTITPADGYGSTANPNGTSFSDWQMTANFTAAKSMTGLYGIVNATGSLQLGGTTAIINAFTAYITPPAGAAGVKVQSAFTDAFGNVTLVQGLPTDASPASSPATSTSIYTLNGQRLKAPSRGLNLIQAADGRFKKVLY